MHIVSYFTVKYMKLKSSMKHSMVGTFSSGVPDKNWICSPVQQKPFKCSTGTTLPVSFLVTCYSCVNLSSCETCQAQEYFMRYQLCNFCRIHSNITFTGSRTTMFLQGLKKIQSRENSERMIAEFSHCFLINPLF